MLRFFELKKNQTTVSREIVAGLTTFFTMAYIVIVAPAMLHHAGMNENSVFVATCLVAALGSIVSGLLANYPIAFAPGLGLLSYLSYVVEGQLGYSWQAGMAAVLIAGVIFLFISITRIREFILAAIPRSLGYATAAGIGFFIGFIALKNVGLVVSDPVTLVTLGNLHTAFVLLFIVGFFIIAILSHRGVVGAMIIGMAIVSFLGWLLGLVHIAGVVALPDDVGHTVLALNFSELHTVNAIPIIFTLVLIALFDSTGSLLGLTLHLPAASAKEKNARINRALVAESIATIGAGLLGTSTTAPFIESAAGIKAGGRTGLTAIVVALCFLLVIFFAPLAMSIPEYATASALFYVACIMIKPIAAIEWDDTLESIPAAITLLSIPLTFSIVDGVGLGILCYIILKLCIGRIRDVHPMLGILAAAFLIYFCL